MLHVANIFDERSIWKIKEGYFYSTQAFEQGSVQGGKYQVKAFLDKWTIISSKFQEKCDERVQFLGNVKSFHLKHGVIMFVILCTKFIPFHCCFGISEPA